ncbi:MAG: Xaa-Pro peptidase family protein [Thalassobaculales bacterium]
MRYLDRARAGRLMAEDGLDALVLLSPEGFAYATGVPGGPAFMWRRAGAATALVPADPGLADAAVVYDLLAPRFRAASTIADVRQHPIWVETDDLTGLDHGSNDPAAILAENHRRAGRPPGFRRPTTFDAAACFAHLRDQLAERGLLKGRIGLEFHLLSVSDLAALKAAVPEAQWVDGSRTLARIRMVKTADEIAHLRMAVELSEAGIEALVREIRPGVARSALAAAWRAGVEGAAAARGVRNLTGWWEYVSVGPDPWGGEALARPGDLVKVDVGCLIAGYSSDSGRTFTVGRSSPLQRRLFGALAEAYAAGRAEIRPGRLLSDVFHAAQGGLVRAGFPEFTRGHFGHGLGANVGSEEWPFIAADSPLPIEPGMVLAFETPWYVDGVGAMIIEDQMLVTANGHEPMSVLPRELREIGG